MQTPPAMPPPSPPPPSPSLFEPIQLPPTTLSGPLPIVVVSLLANTNPHGSSDRRGIIICRVRKEHFSRYEEFDHSFLLTFYSAKWLDLCNTNLHSLILSPILIWDPGLKPQHLEDKVFLIRAGMIGIVMCFPLGA
ncbi:hypothetical protein HKD37_15G041402 [Glycine soja]